MGAGVAKPTPEGNDAPKLPTEEKENEESEDDQGTNTAKGTSPQNNNKRVGSFLRLSKTASSPGTLSCRCPTT